jgi:AraC family transcriptional regulator
MAWMWRRSFTRSMIFPCLLFRAKSWSSISVLLLRFTNGSLGVKHTLALAISPLYRQEHRPAGTWTGSEKSATYISISPSLIHEIATSADVNPDTLEFAENLGVFDPQIETIALSLLSELRSEGLGGRLYVESLANLLGIHLLRHHSSVKPPSLPRSVGLDRTTLKHVSAHIEEHLAEDLSLAELAAVAALSPYHFARLFKASTGITPYQYVIRRRIERAKLLLSTTTWFLSAIAPAVGFAHESHLALHFKRLTGILPSASRDPPA